MKKIVAFLVLLLSFTSVYAAKINQIVYFGDSLSDNGNLYKLLLHFLPKSPPYFNGRFSNGPTWSEHVSKYYYDKYSVGTSNYAVGGATAIFHMPTPEFVTPATLEIEVDKYLIDSLFSDRSKSLYVIWIGDNDYMFDQDADPAAATKKVVDSIEWAISSLAYYGGKQFLVMNLADSSRTPMVQRDGSPEKLHRLVMTHNQKLDASLKRVKTLYPEINLTFLNVYDLFNDFMDNTDKYNQKYNVNINNTTESCWTGGYWLKNQISEQSLSDEIQQSLRTNKADLPANFDAQAMSKFILGSPELAYSYKMSKAYDSGALPCANPNEHMFWDSIHPSAVIHMMLSQVVIEMLGNQISG